MQEASTRRRAPTSRADQVLTVVEVPVVTQRAQVGIVALIGLVVGAIAALLTAPTGSSSPEVSLIAHSADAAAEAGSAKAEFTMTVAASGLPGMEMTGDAVFDFDAQAFAVTMGIGGGGIDAVDMEMRLLGTTMYMRMPDALGAPTPWVSLDLTAVGGDMLAGLGAGSDVTQTLDYLRGAGNVTHVGGETIRGVSTTHYRADVDLGAALGDVPSAQKAQLETAIEQFEAMTGTRSLPVDVWIDNAGLVRRMAYSLDVDMAELEALAGEPMDMSMTFAMDIFDYGVPVSVSAPPAGQVTDMSANLDALSGLSTF